MRLIRAFKDQPIKTLVDQIGAEVSNHYDGDSPPDDLTILALRRRG